MTREHSRSLATAGPSSAQSLAAEQPAPAPSVAIELAAHLSGGVIRGQHQLQIRGRITANLPVEQVFLVVGGTVQGQLQFGAGQRPMVRDQVHAFSFHLTRPSSEAASPCGFTIAARTDDDALHGALFVATPHPAHPGAAVVVSGPTAPDDADLTPPVALYVERAVIDRRGQLLVEGWALSFTRIVTVRVLSGEERVGAAKLGRPRDDVARAYAQYPNAARSGFNLAVPLGEEARKITTLRVQLICLNGDTHEAVMTPERIAALLQPEEAAPNPGEAKPVPSSQAVEHIRRAIQMYCDDVFLRTDGTLKISGWAVCATGVAAVEVHLDGELVGEAELGEPRPDVAQKYPSIAMARFSGFHFEKRVRESANNEHQIVLVVRNGLDDTRAETCIATATDAPPVSPPISPGVSGTAISSAEGSEFRLEVDRPVVKGGAVADPVVGRLTIEGWSMAAAGVAAVEVFIDDQRLGEAHYGLARRDVAETFPDHPNALRVGYVFHCPLRSLRNGEHAVRIDARAADGDTVSRQFRIEVKKAEESNGFARIRRSMPPAQAELYADVLERLDHHPEFWLILRQGERWERSELAATLRSLDSQIYANWRLLIAADVSGDIAEIRSLIAGHHHSLASRIDVVRDLARFAFTPGYYGLLGPGDELGCDALAEIAALSGLHHEADLIYADESRISPVSDEREPFFKPDYSPDLLLSTNYIGRPWFASSDLLRHAGIASEALRQNSEYDLVLRCAERAREVRHIPKLLCQRARIALDVSTEEEAALASAAERRRIEAKVLPGCIAGTWRFRRTSPARGMVSIIIPTCAAHGHIKTCIETLRARTAYRHFEIIAIDNIPAQEKKWKQWLAKNVDKVVALDESFNWSRFNNRAVRQAAGEYLLFLNDDIEIIQEEWLDAMLEHAQREEVGIVGPQLLYPDRKVQHAGMFLSSLGLARHAFRMSMADDPCYFGLALTQRNVIAVTGACMLVRGESFRSLGGFDEAHEVVNNDVDYCLRSHEAGLLTVYTPHATLIHHELASRDKLADVFHAEHFNARWRGLFAEGDPYFNPRLAPKTDDFRPDDEPVQEVFVGHPAFRREEIRRILVVKLDHIGDFVTSIPAIRRLKTLFPAATLHVLAGRAARSLVTMEPSIDGHIEFEFFHARSGLGQKELDQSAFEELRERLVPYRFDLAVDLRRHLDTRIVLRYTGARILAGYDRTGLHTFLDIALEWEDDLPLVRKRTHVSDALINLVDAIGTAVEPRRVELALPAGRRADDLAFLPRRARRLFTKPVVAVQLGVGNAVRQWPAEHFVALIELLVRKSNVNIVLIGGPDEAALAEGVLAELGKRDEVVSLVGKTRLEDLPVLLSACALYVGNNTGPKHIAAGLGVPTIGVHSGVVDAVEWGPLGKRAIALQRNMLCSPCYWVTPSDCPRDLACMKQLEPGVVYRYCELLLARRSGSIAGGKVGRERNKVSRPCLAQDHPMIAPGGGSQKSSKTAAGRGPAGGSKKNPSRAKASVSRVLRDGAPSKRGQAKAETRKQSRGRSRAERHTVPMSGQCREK